MASLKYDNVFSRFFTKVEAFDFIYEEMSEEMMAEFMLSWLRSAIAYPHIRRLFTTISMDDEERNFDYTLRYNVDEFSDSEFITEILAYGMVHAWLEPKVRSITSIYQNFTSSEQKLRKKIFLSQFAALGNLAVYSF